MIYIQSFFIWLYTKSPLICYNRNRANGLEPCESSILYREGFILCCPSSGESPPSIRAPHASVVRFVLCPHLQGIKGYPFCSTPPTSANDSSFATAFLLRKVDGSRTPLLLLSKKGHARLCLFCNVSAALPTFFGVQDAKAMVDRMDAKNFPLKKPKT